MQCGPFRTGMKPKPSLHLAAALGAGLLAGVGHALVELAIDCRAPSSEACFWGKELFLFTLGVSVPVIGGAVAALVYAGLAWHRRRQSRNDAD